MDIFKTLPKTNCRECNSASCLAFAMKVAAGKANFAECPTLSDDSIKTLEEMLEPPMREVIITRGEKKAVLGGEKVMFRHDESFYNPTVMGIEIPSNLDDAQLKNKIAHIEALKFERVGEIISIDMTATRETGDEKDFTGYVRKVYEESSLPLLIKTSSNDSVKKILSWPSGEGIILSLSPETARGFSGELKNLAGAVSITASTKEEAVETGKFFRENGIKNGIIEISATRQADVMNLLYTTRLEALAFNNRILGYPTLYWPEPGKMQLMASATGIMKYASASVISEDDPDTIQALLTLRQNIFTDPRRPIQVEAKLYSFGDVTPDSPVMITTNFSLTYFTVAQEIEASRVPAYLLVVDTDGTSVLTAWSADKFNEKTIVKSINTANLKTVVSHNRIIIPGYVSMLKEDIENESDWEVTVGPAEAVGIPDFLRTS
jgi:acetyl-CoA decarbonylase/synthase, CODH/ACS complex subunit gamma